MARKAWLKRGFAAVEVAFVIADLNPIISEPIRLGTLFGVQAFSHNVLAAALSFGAVTLVLDALGAMATADLLDRKLAKNIIAKTNEVISRLRITRLLDIKTNFAADLSITLLVGTPITIILKQRQDPVRRREVNLRFGLVLSCLASIASALQGGAIVAGLWHPTALSVSLAVLALASIVATSQVIKSRFQPVAQ